MSNPGAEAGNNPLRLARNLCAHETVYTHWGQCLQESVIPDQRQAGKKNFKVWEIFLSARGFPQYNGTFLAPQCPHRGESMVGQQAV